MTASPTGGKFFLFLLNPLVDANTTVSANFVQTVKNSTELRNRTTQEVTDLF